MIRVWGDDEHRVHLYLRQHAAVIGKCRRLFLDWIEYFPLITAQILLVRVAKRDNFHLRHLRGIDPPMIAAHAAAADDSKTYLLHSGRNPSKWACPRQTIWQRYGGDKIGVRTVRRCRARGGTDDGGRGARRNVARAQD